MTSAHPLSGLISTTLAQHNVITVQQLSYLSNTTSDEARLTLKQHFEHLMATTATKPLCLYPILLVSGLRIVHGQYAYVYLLTYPSQLESTKRKFIQVSGIQYYGLIQSPREPTPTTFDDLLAYATQLVAQLEVPATTSTNIINTTIIKAASKPKTKPTTSSSSSCSSSLHSLPSSHDDFLSTRGFGGIASPSAATKEVAAISSNTKAAEPKNNTIVHKQSKLQFGIAKPASTPIASSTTRKSSVFDDFDDDNTSVTDPSTSGRKSIPTLAQTAPSIKRAAPTSSLSLFDSVNSPSSFEGDDAIGNEVSSKSLTKTGYFQQPKASTGSLFDDFDNDDSAYNINSTTSRSTKRSSNTNITPKTSLQPKGPNVNLIVEDEESDEGDALFDSLNTYSTAQSTKNGSFMTNSYKSLMGDDGSDDDMVKISKGAVIGERPSANPKKRVIIDDDNDSLSDVDEYSSLAAKSSKGDQRHTGYQEMSKQEYAQYLKEEDEAKKADQQAKDAATAATARESLLKATTLHSTTRTDPLTGKLQKMVKLSKTITSIDDDGFEVKKKEIVEEWVDMSSAEAVRHTNKGTITTTTTTTTTKSTPEATQSNKPPVPKKDPPKGGIMSFFSKK